MLKEKLIQLKSEDVVYVYWMGYYVDRMKGF